jgi:hypothetical protein
MPRTTSEDAVLMAGSFAERYQVYTAKVDVARRLKRAISGCTWQAKKIGDEKKARLVVIA